MSLDALLASGVIAVVRLREAVPLRAAATALAAGGVGAVEITLTTPGALDSIGDLASDVGLRRGGCVVGAGTVLDERAARDAIAAGAQFVVSPTLDPALIRLCRDRDIPCMPGAFTPTEILAAWRVGAPVVKLFPSSVLGPRFLREVLAPMPFVRLVPSGGVSLENAAEWIRAGAAAISVGSALVNSGLPGGLDDDLTGLTERARSFVECVAEARRSRAEEPT
jgi:2-dehydro-3-deoxyphosphogluconate aldolase / (4S)-4-hydroxy-2-oxoglutarate aldolase